MTTKQFNWLKNHQPIEVWYVKPYDCKVPKNFHCFSRMTMEFNGEYFVFKGTYYNCAGKYLEEHFGRYKIHYKNVKWLSYRLKYKY